MEFYWNLIESLQAVIVWMLDDPTNLIIGLFAIVAIIGFFNVFSFIVMYVAGRFGGAFSDLREQEGEVVDKSSMIVAPSASTVKNGNDPTSENFSGQWDVVVQVGDRVGTKSCSKKLYESLSVGDKVMVTYYIGRFGDPRLYVTHIELSP